MNAVLETCAVTWWRGYVRGRLQAVAGDPPGVVAESKPLRGGDAGPDRTPDAVAALDELTRRLVDAGWEVRPGASGEAWYARAFTRRSVVLPDPPAERAPARVREIDAGLVALLHDELQDARDAAARERRARLDVERHLHAVEQQPESPSRGRRRTAPVLAAWAVAVAFAAGITAALSQSVYATAVVALTTAAVALGVDSWRVSR